MRNRRRSHPVPEVAVGRAAELRVASILEERLRGTGWEYAAGVRVPAGRRKAEIDLVVTTPEEIWLVELKNWSGVVRLEGERVIQHRAGGRGVVDHGNLLGKLRGREKSLRRYLRRSMDEIPRLWTVLVFCNESVGIDEKLIGRDDMDVVKLREFVGALPLDEDHGHGVTEAIEEARRRISELGSWDLLFFYGGQVLSGDLVDISVDELRDRGDLQSLRINAPRGFFDIFRSELSLRITAVDENGDEIQLDVDLDETLRFHCAGSKKPEEFSLRHLVGVVFQSR